MKEKNYTATTNKELITGGGTGINSTASHLPFPVVAIGAGAGGLEALYTLLTYLPSNLGMAYVVMIGVPAEQSIVKSLQQRTSMQVIEASNNTVLEMDRVYVLPADSYLTLGLGRFVHLPVYRHDKTYHAIDHFFSTLGTIYNNNAFAVILSGTGADGTAGIRVVQSEGGITFAQDESAAFRGMPQFAIESGSIDFVLPPRKIAEHLTALKDYSFRNGAILRHLEKSQVQVDRIYLLLADRYGMDFSLYKQTAVNRRIIRRMTLNRIPNTETYLRHLEASASELDMLYKDLLSGTGGFFREPALGKLLVKKVFPSLLDGREQRDAIRVWIPACAGGEEAFSFAIYLFEFLQSRDLQIPVQIFASDLNDTVIETARKAFYTPAAVQHISPARLRRFFVKMDGGYQVAKPIREMCIFATHNFLKDPAFCRMDMVVCQHTLFSLEKATQEKALQVFHYALKSNGFLVLDKTRAFDEPQQLFQRAFKEWNICRKVPGNFAPPPPSLAAIGTGHTADRLMLSRFAPAAVLVDGQGYILRFYGAMARFLKPQAGPASLGILDLVHEELRQAIYNVLQQVKERGAPIVQRELFISIGDQAKNVTVEAIPLNQTKESAGTEILIVMRDNAAPGDPAATHARSGEDGTRIRELEDSLKEAGRQMLAVHEEFDKTRMELQTAHEEVLSANEELQSINEELQSSKEELQSTNEELMTMNEEVLLRNAELKESIEYAEAIVETIRQPLMDLYSDLRIRKANKAFYTLFPLTYDQVEGNYLQDLAGGLFNIPSLIESLRSTISRRLPFQDIELKCPIDGVGEKTILFSAARINGQPGKRARVLLVMEDITERKLVEKQKDEFISIASHELRTPATSIQAYAQLLYNEFVAANDQHAADLLGRLNRQVSRLTSLTRDLLDVTRITQGQLRLQEKFFDLTAMARETLEELQQTSAIKLQLSSNVQPAMFWGDRDRLAQVLRNLASNAIRYTPEDRPVLVSLSLDDEQLRLTVQDFGIGMSPETCTRIFDRFFREENANARAHPGLGLGLYISQQIVHEHEGRIEVQSEEGSGSVFTVTLPVRRKPDHMS